MAKKKTTTKKTSSAKASRKTTTSSKTAVKAKKKPTRVKSTTKTKKKTDELDQLNETGKRQSADRRKSAAPVKAESRKVQRRRQIDPTTCERDYKDCEIEFMHALDEYKRASGRMFPTCSEILEVIMKLGYRKVDVTAEAQVGVQDDQSTDQETTSFDTEMQVNNTLDSIEQISF